MELFLTSGKLIIFALFVSASILLIYKLFRLASMACKDSNMRQESEDHGVIVNAATSTQLRIQGSTERANGFAVPASANSIVLRLHLGETRNEE